jgi:restriction system protein
MAIPDFQSLMLPMLRRLEDGRPRSVRRELSEELADEYGLSAEERSRLLPSGGDKLFQNRLAWATTHMSRAGLIERPVRGQVQITAEGRTALASNPGRIDMKFLRRYPSYVEAARAKDELEISTAATAPLEAGATPDELVETAVSAMRSAIETELLSRVMSAPPAFFESLVIQLLVKMGYGGSYAEAAQVVGQSGDNGIDGVIKEDRLGLDAIYVQAKRWSAAVGSPEIQKFAGSLEWHRATKGVFITTAKFTPDARQFAKGIGKRIVLVDGAMLSELMLEYGVGVSPDKVYTVPRLDEDFFADT